jgi:hypothetical protein
MLRAHAQTSVSYARSRGKTALSWQGVRHNIAFRERIILWGEKPYAFPDWVGDHLLYSYVARSRKLIQRGCGQKLGLPGGSSCSHTKIAFERFGFT